MAIRIVELVTERIDQEPYLARIAHPAAGAVASFAGTVRDHHEGRRVEHLVYSAHEEMARAQLERIARQIEERWPVLGAVLVHRLGRLEIGETSVLVAVASPHRAEAFEACRWGIETLKTEVPIWKKEHYADGPARWVLGSGTVEVR